MTDQILVHHVTPTSTMLEIFDRRTLARLGCVYGPTGEVWRYIDAHYRRAYVLSSTRTTDADLAASFPMGDFAPGYGPACEGEGMRFYLDAAGYAQAG